MPESMAVPAVGKAPNHAAEPPRGFPRARVLVAGAALLAVAVGLWLPLMRPGGAAPGQEVTLPSAGTMVFKGAGLLGFVPYLWADSRVDVACSAAGWRLPHLALCASHVRPAPRPRDPEPPPGGRPLPGDAPSRGTPPPGGRTLLGEAPSRGAHPPGGGPPMEDAGQTPPPAPASARRGGGRGTRPSASAWAPAPRA